MTRESYNDFVAAICEEFAEAMASESIEISGADAYTVIAGISPSILSPELLAAISDAQIEELRSGFSRYLEIADDSVAVQQISTAIFRTLHRWPPNESANDAQNA